MVRERVFDVVRRIPPGRVASYGRVGALAGCTARQVGRALAALPDHTDVPWQRVVNASGGISLPGRRGARQRALLRAEGVKFDRHDVIDARIYGWPGPGAADMMARGSE